MEQRVFGRTGLRVPVVGMGTWQTYDVRGTEVEARRAVTDAAFETGATFFVHNLVAWPRRLAALERWRAAGSVRVIGLTHYSPDTFAELRRAMADRRVGAIQIPYNPLERDVESVILPAAADLGLGVIVMRPLGEGRLARRRVTPEASPAPGSGRVATGPWLGPEERAYVARLATA
ncbi:MAG: aldo/keto reductase [Acidobacteria bacterium]|nr:aldo/keto reductase [Acidobacteriota bacterium]